MSGPAASAYYNEVDPRAAQWLRNLIAAGAIAPGIVDERDIRDVTPAELSQYKQCHFFAGIGVWSYALRLADWPDSRPVWTGSCPCQPFSSAGRGAGFADERHLWPHWHHLIRICRPPVVFGEQVASNDGLAWLDLVSADLEGENYTVRALDTCSAGFGAPHIRQRLWIVANADHERRGKARNTGTAVRPARCSRADVVADPAGRGGRRIGTPGPAVGSGERDSAHIAGGHTGRCSSRILGHGRGQGRQGLTRHGDLSTRRPQPAGSTPEAGDTHRLGHHTRERCQELRHARRPEPSGHADSSDFPAGPGPTNGHWRDADWLRCRDGRWRAVEPGTFPLAHGTPSRVGLLRGYGNAINAENAAAVIRAATPELMTHRL